MARSHSRRRARVRAPRQAEGVVRRRWPGWSVALLLTSVGLLVYANSLHGAFIFDDQTAVVGNPSIRHFWPLSNVFRSPANTPLAGRPVVSLSFAANYAIGGLEVRGYHLVNVGIHILCSLFFFAIVRRTLAGRALHDRFGEAADQLAAACALLWLVHPLQTEAVNYVTERTESLMGLFYLATVYAAIRAGSDRQIGWGAVAVLSCALGMATKEVMATAPLMVVAYDVFFTGETLQNLIRRRWPLYAGLAATWGILAALIWSGPRSGTAGFSASVSPLEYAANQCVMIVHYVRLAAWPRPLLLDYGVPQPLAPAQVLPSAVVLAALAGGTIWACLRRSVVGFAGIWFFMILAPSSSVIPIATEVGAERRMYLPLAALIGLAVMFGWNWLKPRTIESIPWAMASLVVGAAGVLGWLSVQRNADYRTAASIWRTVVAERPSARAHYNLGLALEDEGRTPEAVAEYEEALRVDADAADPRFRLGIGLERMGAVTDAAEAYRQYLRRKPQDAAAHNLLGVALSKQGKLDEAIEHYRQALRLDPALSAVHANLGQNLMAQQRVDEAIEQFQFAIDAEPDNAHLHNALGVGLASRQRLDEALAHYARAVQLDSSFADAQLNLGLALRLSGRSAEGEEHLREAVRQNPALRPVVQQMAEEEKSRQLPSSGSAR